MPDRRGGAVLAAAAVAVATALVFARSLGAGFLDYDDLRFLAANPHLRAPGAADVLWALGRNWVIWYPLTWLSWFGDRLAWGPGPFGYHLTSVLLHALNAALAFRLFDRLLEKNGAADASSRRAAAALGALAFALHPLRVESVTWASERGDVLCGAFALGSALAWVEGRLGAALALHACGLASKGANMAAPAALALAEALGLFGKDRPPRGRLAGFLGAMLALSAADAALAASLQARAGAAWDAAKLGPLARAAVVLYNDAHGLAKNVWPFRLEAVYPLPRPLDPFAPRFLASAALVAAISALAWRLRRRQPAVLGAWGAYLLLMSPTAGFVKVGATLTADRYTYLPSVVLCVLAVSWLPRVSVLSRRRLLLLSFAVLAVFAAGAWARQGDFLDSRRFWNAMVEADPRNAAARVNAASYRLRDGDAPGAERLLREAVAAEPGLGSARNALGMLLTNTGRPAEALPEFQAALSAEPAHPATRYNLAVALIRLGRTREAADALRAELALARPEPRDPLRESFAPGPDVERTARLLASLDAPR